MSLHNVKSKAHWYLYKQSGHSWNVSLAKPHSKVRSAEVVKVAQTQWMWIWVCMICYHFVMVHIWWYLGPWLEPPSQPWILWWLSVQEPIDLQNLQRVGKSIWTFYWHYPGYILKIPERQPDITWLCPCASIFGFHLSFTNSKRHWTQFSAQALDRSPCTDFLLHHALGKNGSEVVIRLLCWSFVCTMSVST